MFHITGEPLLQGTQTIHYFSEIPWNSLQIYHTLALFDPPKNGYTVDGRNPVYPPVEVG